MNTIMNMNKYNYTGVKCLSISPKLPQVIDMLIEWTRLELTTRTYEL